MKPVRKPLVLGISGGTGSGKTTISRAIIAELPPGTVAYLQHDAYYRDRPDLVPEERAALNFDHPESLETELLVKHLHDLCRGKTIECPIYDFKHHRREQTTLVVKPAPVVIVEGILIFADPPLCERLDIKVFVDTPADIRILRRARRDIEQRGRTFEDVRRQYYATVRPMHEAFVEPTKYQADVILPEGGDRRVAIDLLVERVKRELRERGIPGM